MTQFQGIPIVRSGEKYRTAAGFTAIKNGIKKSLDPGATVPGRKPGWLRVRVPGGGKI